MKLLFCLECHDLFKLQIKTKRSCRCGKVKGYYKNNSEAIVNGEGLSLAIDNHDLAAVIVSKLPINSKHNIECWVRPHEGELNPNTRVDKSKFNKGEKLDFKPLIPVMADGKIENFMFKVNGKSFCCEHCGCNVFYKPDDNNLNKFRCNSCGESYEGEK